MILDPQERIDDLLLTANGRFMRDIREGTTPNPLNRRQCLWNDQVIFQLNVMGGYMWLFDFYSLEQGKGNASRCLKFICALADKHQITLSLSPFPFGTKPGLKKHELADWYERHGFQKKNDFPVYLREPR